MKSQTILTLTIFALSYTPLSLANQDVSDQVVHRAWDNEPLELATRFYDGFDQDFWVRDDGIDRLDILEHPRSPSGPIMHHRQDSEREFELTARATPTKEEQYKSFKREHPAIDASQKWLFKFSDPKDRNEHTAVIIASFGTPERVENFRVQGYRANDNFTVTRKPYSGLVDPLECEGIVNTGWDDEKIQKAGE